MSETNEMLERWVAICGPEIAGLKYIPAELGRIAHWTPTSGPFWAIIFSEHAIDLITMAKLRELKKYVHKTYVEMVDITASGNNADEWSIVWKFNGHGYDYFFRAPTLAGAVLAAFEAIKKEKGKK